MIRVFTRLYLRQLGRLLTELGLWRKVMAVFLAVVFLFLLGSKVKTDPGLIILAVFALVASVHFQRNDRHFLKIVNIDEKALFFIHYHLIAAPAYFLLVIFQQFMPFLYLLVGISILPFLSFTNPFAGFGSSFQNLTLFKNLPRFSFEFISGLRKNKVWLIILYTLAVVFFQYPMVPFCAIIVFTFITTSFYNESEPWIMLEVYQLPPRKFLLQKIKSHLSAFWILCLPLIFLFLLQEAAYWYVMPVLMVVSSVIQSLSICLKYTFYEPGKNFDNSIFMVIYGLSLLVIFFIPVPFVMLVYYFRKATQNLNHYLYDYH